jgi:hypothetical protein
MLTETQMNEAWEKFGRGDGLTDEELDAMIAQTEAALPYLFARGRDFFLARKETILNLDRLKDFRKWRKERA